MDKIVIADVLYTVTDETFYVLDTLHDNASKYDAQTLEGVYNNLKQDGWDACGKVNRSDGSLADMFVKGDTYIAVWKE